MARSARGCDVARVAVFVGAGSTLGSLRSRWDVAGVAVFVGAGSTLGSLRSRWDVARVAVFVGAGGTKSVFRPHLLQKATRHPVLRVGPVGLLLGCREAVPSGFPWGHPATRPVLASHAPCRRRRTEYGARRARNRPIEQRCHDPSRRGTATTRGTRFGAPRLVPEAEQRPPTRPLLASRAPCRRRRTEYGAREHETGAIEQGSRKTRPSRFTGCRVAVCRR